jgi:16S rRNA (guanine527-N7)-methyltransferase
MNPELFQATLEKDNIILNEKQMRQFDQYLVLLQEWNEKVNLTAITEEEEVYLKHFYDSATLAQHINFEDKAITLCDVGSGAGFPSIPLKIMFPNIEVTIVDSLNKRINFLQLLVDELGLENVHLFHARAEDFGQDKAHRNQYDVVTARAVANLSVLAEFCLPITKMGGTFAAMKASKATEELNASKNAIKTLGGKTQDVASFELPHDAGERNIILIKKDRKTPGKYPRKAGTPNKNPL